MVDRNAEVLAQHLLTLPPHDRARLAELLLASLEGEDAEVDAAWSEEIERRLAEFDRGAMEAIPAEEVFSALERRLGR